MNYTYLKGIPTHLGGRFPKPGNAATMFYLVKTDLSETSLGDYKGSRIVLNIFPSLDTDTCAMSVRRFNTEAASLNNTIVLCISMDLPFAAKRFCAIEGIDNVVMASAFRSPHFGTDYGVKILNGPLTGLLARAIVIIDSNGYVIYSQLVREITQEPNYDAAIAVLTKHHQPL